MSFYKSLLISLVGALGAMAQPASKGSRVIQRRSHNTSANGRNNPTGIRAAQRQARKRRNTLAFRKANK